MIAPKLEVSRLKIHVGCLDTVIIVHIILIMLIDFPVQLELTAVLVLFFRLHSLVEPCIGRLKLTACAQCLVLLISKAAQHLKLGINKLFIVFYFPTMTNEIAVPIFGLRFWYTALKSIAWQQRLVK